MAAGEGDLLVMLLDLSLFSPDNHAAVRAAGGGAEELLAQAGPGTGWTVRSHVQLSSPPAWPLTCSSPGPRQILAYVNAYTSASSQNRLVVYAGQRDFRQEPEPAACEGACRSHAGLHTSQAAALSGCIGMCGSC